MTISPYSACHSALGYQISSKSVQPQRGYDVISIFKMAATTAQFYFRFQIGCRRSLSDVSFYQKTKFRSYNWICGWDITISGLKKQTSAILVIYFWFRFRPHCRSRHAILHLQSANFYPNRTAHGTKMTSCRFSRRRILDFRDQVMYDLLVVNRDHSSKLLSFFLRKSRFCILATDTLTDKQMDRPVALSRSRCRERRLSK